MKTRGWLCLGVVALGSVLAATGCGGPTAEPVPPPPPPADDDVKIVAMPDRAHHTEEFSFETKGGAPTGAAKDPEAVAEEQAGPTGPLPVPTTCPGAMPANAPAPGVAAPPAPAAPASAPAAAECYPPKDFVSRVCERHSPSAALALFTKGTPWKRAYINGYCEAWNVTAGTTANDELEAGEEVLVLRTGVSRRRGVADGGSSLFGLRWNGNCVMLDEGQVSSDGPETPKHALISWNWLSDSLQAELRKDPKVGQAFNARRTACKTSSGFGSKVTPECEEAGKALSAAVFQHVRGGGAMPPPEPVP